MNEPVKPVPYEAIRRIIATILIYAMADRTKDIHIYATEKAIEVYFARDADEWHLQMRIPLYTRAEFFAELRAIELRKDARELCFSNLETGIEFGWHMSLVFSSEEDVLISIAPHENSLPLALDLSRLKGFG